MIPAEIVIATSQGRHVFPVAAGNKSPLVKWRSEDPASSDLDQVNKWHIRWGDTNWGLATGAVSGVFVIDTDSKEGYDWVVAQGLTDTYVVKTGGNKHSYGYHFYFQHPGVPIKNSARDLAPGVDVRGDGGYVLMPPSVTDLPYTVAKQAAVAAAPAWLVDKVRKTESERLAAVVGDLSAQDVEHGLNIYRKACREYPETPDGQWNIELNKLAGLAGRMVAAGVLDEARAYELACDAGKAYVQDNRKAFTATWRSGFKWGLQSPWVPLGPEDVGFQNGIPAPYDTNSLTKKASEYKMSSIKWIWPQWLPLGKLVIYAGPGGVGKSTVTFSWAATISSGGKWPDGLQCKPGRVLIWSGEDDPSDTIIPRLTAMGADLDMIEMINGEQGMPFDPAKDFARLKLKYKHGDVKLLIIDPIVSAVTGDGNKTVDVRRSLQAIVDFGIDLGCCVVGISHFNKGSQGKNPTERVTGSQAFTALSRMTIVSQKDHDTQECVMARSKSNISVDSGGIKYKIEPMMLPQGIQTTRVQWLEGIDGSAQELLSDVEPGEEKVSERKVDAARDYLKLTLGQRELPLKQLIEQGGFSKASLMRAKEQLPIRVKKEGKNWVWSMPFGPPISDE